jgi:diguanylate cyclase (GGDEF)-like protein
MGLELLLCIVLGALLIWLLPKFGMLWCGVLALLAIVGTMTTGWIAFDRYNMLIDTIYPSAIIILIYISGSFSIYFTTRTRLIRTTWLVEHDMLTGSLSRRTWYDRAIKALDNCADRQRFLVAILDIDFFKKVNDTYGHITGDEALKHTVNILSKALGSNVSFGRLGGEEFGLNLEINSGASSPNGSIPKVATDLLDSVRAQLENTPLQIDDLIIPITISIGATFPKDSEVLNDAIDRADKALYNSKESGRNRVTLL